MRKPNRGEVAVVASVAAIIGLGFPLYKGAESLRHSLNEKKRDAKIDPILRSAAISAGNMVLRSAIDGGPIPSVTADKNVKGGVDLTLTASDGEHEYGIVVEMLKKKDGEPDPSTTYGVVETEFYGEGTKIRTQNSILGGGALGGHWNSMYEELPAQAQDRPTERIDTFQTPTLSVAKNLAGMVRLEADLISILPPVEGEQIPNGKII